MCLLAWLALCSLGWRFGRLSVCLVSVARLGTDELRERDQKGGGVGVRSWMRMLLSTTGIRTKNGVTVMRAACFRRGLYSRRLTSPLTLFNYIRVSAISMMLCLRTALCFVQACWFCACASDSFVRSLAAAFTPRRRTSALISSARCVYGGGRCCHEKHQTVWLTAVVIFPRQQCDTRDVP